MTNCHGNSLGIERTGEQSERCQRTRKIKETGMSNSMERRAGLSYRLLSIVALIMVLLGAPGAWASVGGSISGTVKDPAGSVIGSADVTVRETSTGLSYQTHSDSKGLYTFPVLPVGHYDLQVQAPGFSSYQRTGVILDTNASLNLDAPLQLGAVAQTVSVLDNALHVETTSTQLGQVITGRQMTAVPLDGRSFTDLLSLQAGVAPQSSLLSTTVQDVGATALNPSGTLNRARSL